GVKRQYSGTLGKIGNCQISVSVHAVGERGRAPLGWALYLPEEWCADSERRRKAQIPDALSFQTKPQLAAGLARQPASWRLARACAAGCPAAPGRRPAAGTPRPARSTTAASPSSASSPPIPSSKTTSRRARNG